MLRLVELEPNKSFDAIDISKAHRDLEIIREYISGKYSYDLPAKRLEQGDPGFNFYMCQNSVLGGVAGRIELFISHAPLLIEDKKRLTDLGWRLLDIARAGRDNTRLKTEHDMNEIRAIMIEVVEIGDRSLEQRAAAA